MIMLAVTFLLYVAFGIDPGLASLIGAATGGTTSGFWLKGRSVAPQQVAWLQISKTLLYIVFAWLSVFAGTSLRFDIFWIAVSGLFAVYLLAVLTDWHDSGQRVWEFWLWRLPQLSLPPYRRPRDPWLRRIALIVALLVLISDVVLLVVLLIR